MRLIAAVDALFYTVAKNPSGTPPDVRVTATVDGHVLTLRTGSATVTFSHSRAAASNVPPRPTTSRSLSSS